MDDSIVEKDKQTSRLEAVDWHYDHLEGRKGRPRYKKGMAFIVVHVLIGSVHLVFPIPICLREKTVRRLNRDRPKEKRLPFRTKYRLVRQVLEELKPLFLKGKSFFTENDRVQYHRLIYGATGKSGEDRWGQKKGP